MTNKRNIRRLLARTAAVAVIVLVASAMVSCSGGAKEEGKAEPKAAREIMKEYTHTLATAPDKARAVRTQVENRSEEALKDFEQAP